MALLRCYVHVIVRVCILTRSVSACSTMTHIGIGERARHFVDLHSNGVDYRELIQNHLDAYQAGCPYPDAYYSGLCYDGEFHSVSEDSHWIPFINSSITYLRDTYPRPWNETAEKLVVFLFGVLSHQVADVSWHSLDIEEGFLRAMADINYHGSFGDAHTDGDFGGDVVNLFELDMDYIPLVDTWYVPVRDLVNIYDRMYGTSDRMTPEVIVECTNLLFLGRLGENLGVIEYLYPHYASKSTFLVDRLNDYFLGGLDDMATWSLRLFEEMAYMIDEGTEGCYLPDNPLYVDCGVDGGRTQNSARTLARTLAYRTRHSESDPNRLPRSLVPLRDGDVYVEESWNGVVYRASETYQRRLLAKTRRRRKRQQRKKNRTKYERLQKAEAFYSTQIAYSRLGESLLSGDVNNDGDLDLVISAPGYGKPGNYQQGRVYIVYGDEFGVPSENLTVEIDADIILGGSEQNGRFGTSLTLLDINVDGYSDLAVSAPSVDSDNLRYHGRVYIYLGSENGISPSPNITISCTERYCNLGWSLASGDVNHDGHNDLLIGAPFAPSGGQQRGFVGALAASPSLTDKNMTEIDLDWRWNGVQDNEWFGYSVSHVYTSPTSGILAIGSPTFKLCAQPDCSYDDSDVQSVGKLTVFNTPPSGSPGVTFTESEPMAQLGYEVQAHSRSGQRFLAVAAPTKNLVDVEPDNNATIATQTGEVTVFNCSDTRWRYLFTVVGDREFCRIGKAIQFADINNDSVDDIIITAPLRSDTVADSREEGRVYIFYNNDQKNNRTLSAYQADVILALDEDKARYGYSVAPLRTAQMQLAVGAPHSNMAARLAGLVAVHSL